MNKQEQVTKLFKANPHMTTGELAKEIDCTSRTARYALEAMRIADDVRVMSPKDRKSPAKILLFDLETAPLEVYSWGIWKQVINPGMLIKDWSILSWSAKWLFAADTMGDVVTPAEATNRVDRSVINELWELMDEADIIVAHNATKFDVKKMNARFILNGLMPPSSFRVIDTLSVVRRMFAFTSNKLDYVNGLLNITQKMSHAGFQMWKDCVNGNLQEATAALDTMLEYNKTDVVALEELYMVLRSWIKSHPNVNLYQDVTEDGGKMGCPNCGSRTLFWEGKYYTPAGRFKAFRCGDCFAIGRSRYSDLSKKERSLLGLSIAA